MTGHQKECSKSKDICNKKLECFLLWFLLEYGYMYNTLRTYPILPCRLPFYDIVKSVKQPKCEDVCVRISIEELIDLCKCFNLDASSDDIERKVRLCGKTNGSKMVSGLSSWTDKDMTIFNNYKELVLFFIEQKRGCPLKDEDFYEFNEPIVLLKYLICVLICLKGSNEENSAYIRKIFSRFSLDKQEIESADIAFSNKIESFDYYSKLNNEMKIRFPSGSPEDAVANTVCNVTCRYLSNIGFKRYNKDAVLKVLNSRCMDSSYSANTYQDI